MNGCFKIPLVFTNKEDAILPLCSKLNYMCLLVRPVNYFYLRVFAVLSCYWRYCFMLSYSALLA